MAIVFDQGPIDRAAQNFVSMFLQSQQLEQAERAQELRERQQELAERRFNMEKEVEDARRQTAFQQLAQQAGQPQQVNFGPMPQNPINQLGFQGTGGVAPPQQVQVRNARAGLQSPLAQQVVGQVERQAADARSGEFGTSMAMAPAALEDERLREDRSIIRRAVGATRGADVEAPAPQEFEEAANRLNVPAATRSAVRETLFPSQAESLEQEAEASKNRLDALRNGTAARLLTNGEITMQDLAASNSPLMVSTANTLGLGPDLRQYRDRMISQEESGQALRTTLTEESVDFRQEQGLRDVPLPIVRKALYPSVFGEMTPEQEEQYGPQLDRVEQGIRQERLAAQSSTVAAMEDLPGQATMTAMIDQAVRNDDMETAMELWNQKSEVYSEQLGVPRESPFNPFSVATEEKDVVAFWGDETSTTVTGGTLGKRVVTWVQDNGGDTEKALTELRKRKRKTDNEQLRQQLERMEAELVALRERNVDKIRTF